MKWKIYYGNDSCFSDEAGSPDLAPKLDAQVIVQHDRNHGRYLQFASDYYIWSDSCWLGVDQFGMWEYLFCSPGCKVVLAGRTISNKKYQALYQRAKKDPDFPPKTGFRPGEERLE